MTEGYAGMNAEFRRWNSSTGAWDAIGNINNIGGWAMSRDVHDVSPDQEIAYRQFKGGLRNGGTLPININYTRDSFDTLKSDFENDTAQNYEIVLPDDDNTSAEFEGFIAELSLNAPPGKMTIDFTIQITGEPTIESGSGPSPG